MLLKVNPHKIEIVKSPVNEREINISKCTFEFADEITNDYVKEAYFTFGGTTYKQIIVNNECSFPSEVLTKKGTVEIGVVAYLVENETEIKRYNPSPAYFDTWVGSLKDNAENSEPITPSEMEQFEQALNDGLNEVNDKLDEIDQAIDDVNEAIIETNNLDLDVDKQGKVATVTLTKKDASTKIVTLSDGTSLMFNWDGTKLGIKTDEDAEYTYVDLQGVQGPIGPKGEAFTIKKTYTSVAEMNGDFNNMQLGDYVMIASTVEVEDNAKLYTRGETQWIFISDFSGATGIRGETGLTPNIQIGTVISGTTPNVTRTGTNENPILNFTLVKGDTGATGPQGETGATGNGILSIQKTATVGLVDTYTITFTDGTTTTFDVTNGEDGEVTQTQLDETNDNVSWLQTLTEQMPRVSGQGTDLSLESVLNYRLMKFLPQGVSKQESTTGKNLWGGVSYLNTNSGITFTYNQDGSITANGTSTATATSISIASAVTNNIYVTLEAGTYTAGCENLSNYGNLQVYDTNSNSLSNTFTLSETTSVVLRLRLNANITLNNYVFKLQLEQNTEATSYEPYTGGIPAPNPSYPYMPSRVTGENEIVISNENLFNVNDITRGYELQSDGRINVHSGWYVSDYIKVMPNTDYYLSGTKTSGQTNNFYDINKNVISYVNKLTGLLTTPNDCYYVRFNGLSTQLSDISFVKGSTAPTTYVEHEEQNFQLSLGNIELNSSSDGTVRDGIYGSSDVSYNLFDKNNANILSNTYIGSSSIGISNGAKILYYECKPNTTYTVSKIASQRFIIGDTSETPANGVTVNNRTADNTGTHITITTSSNAQYLVVFYYLSTADTLTEQEILNSIQITEGSEVKPYFPYGQVGMWYKREYIGKVVLDGSETWYLNSNVFNLRSLTDYKNTQIGEVSMYCNKYLAKGNVNGSVNAHANGNYTSCFLNDNATPRLFIRDDRYTTVNDYKTYLQTEYNNGTPVIVDYVKTQYTDIPITDTTLINQLNNIYNNAHSYNGITNITTTYEDGNEQMYLDIEALKNVWDTSL